MKINFQTKQVKKVGLDIGNHSVKIMEVSGSGNRMEFSGAGLKKIAGLSKTEISNAIRALAAESGVTSNQAAISIEGPSSIARFVSMPKMSETDLASAMKFETEKLIPFNMSECATAFQILNKNTKDGKMSVLLVAAKKEYIDERIKIASDAGFTTTVVDVDSLALVNSFLRNFTDIGGEKNYALLNIGARFTNIAILRGGDICFARDIAAGGDNFDVSGANVVVNGLLDEVRLSFSYQENQSGKGVDELFVSGGCAAIHGISEAFEEALGLKPKSWNPLHFLSGSSSEVEKIGNNFAIASGLALR